MGADLNQSDGGFVEPEQSSFILSPSRFPKHLLRPPHPPSPLYCPSFALGGSKAIVPSQLTVPYQVDFL